MKKNKKFLWIGLIAVVILAVMIVPRFLAPKEVPDAVPPPVVEVEKASVGTIELSSGLVGTVEPSDMVYITPKMPGEVTEVLVKAGDMVTEGQVLCKIDTKQVDSARLSLESARVSLEDAKKNLERMQVLYQSGNISQQSFEQLENSVKMAQLQYDGAKLGYDTQLEYSTITAPISGLVESTDMEVHDMVSQQNLICVISGEGNKAVSFSVTERIVKNLHVGDAIRIEKNGTEYQGTISEISSMIDQATGLFKVKATVGDGEALATGSRVKLYAVSDRAENVMTLPVDVIYYEGGAAFLYTYDNGTVHKVPVEVGLYDSERIQILSGITAADTVITTWSPEFYEGAVVTLSGQQKSEEQPQETQPDTEAESSGTTAE